MALNQDQWLKKLKELVPAWVFEDEKFNLAIFSGMAKILEESQVVYENHLKETFIDTAEEGFLNIHADERSVEKLDTDSLSTYRQKIKNILNNSNCHGIKGLIDPLLIQGEATLVENYNISNFYDRESFLNRDAIDNTITYNSFTVIVDPQIPSAETFMTRENFFNREEVFGSSKSLTSVLENVVETVNKNIAYGTVYKLIERK